MREIRRLFLPTLAVCAAGLLSGCGPKTVSVKGQVKYNGQPVTGGRIFITSTAGTSKAPMASGEIDENGNFSLSNAPAGEVVITVDNRDLKGTGPIGASASYQQGEKAAGGGPGGPPGGGGKPGGPGPGQPPPGQLEKMMGDKGIPTQAGAALKGTYMKIPEKYYSTGTSDLKYTLSGGENLPLELKD